MSDEVKPDNRERESEAVGTDEDSDEFSVVEPEKEPADAGTDAAKAEKEADRKLRAESYKIMASVGNFGLFLIIAVLFGWFIGSTMDKFFGIKPVFTVFWIATAVAASILELVRNVKAAKKLGEEEGANQDV